MVSRDYIVEKIRSLPNDSLKEVLDFIEFLEAREKGQSEIAEYGMEDYLNQLLTYEGMLAAGKIKWR